MADLITHVLLAYALATLAGWAVGWLEPRWVVVAMVGSVLPDANRIDLVVPSRAVEAALGIPFSWGAIHTAGGVLLLSAAGAMLFGTATARRRGFGLLVAGGFSHFLVDGVKRWADGYGGAYLYPFSWWRAPTPGLYVSSDRWILLVAAAIALAVFALDYLRSTRTGDRETPLSRQ